MDMNTTTAAQTTTTHNHFATTEVDQDCNLCQMVIALRPIEVPEWTCPKCNDRERAIDVKFHECFVAYTGVAGSL